MRGEREVCERERDGRGRERVDGRVREKGEGDGRDVGTIIIKLQQSLVSF